MISANWTQLSKDLKSSLGLQANPMAINFLHKKPDTTTFSSKVPPPTEDGRTGKVSAGCVFWMHGSERTFATVPEDHYNCSVGSFTHGLKTLAEVQNNKDIAAIVECEWVSPEIFPQIPHIKEKFEYIQYGPLSDVKSQPDVVFLRINGKGLMILKDAFPNIRIEGKPQCHIVPIAKESGEIAVSSGCMLSRVRTGMTSNEMTVAIPGGKVQEVMRTIQATCEIDNKVAVYASDDAKRFRR
ncbi:MAG TPA: DUF169 domain-containing protein [Candidatus Hodarchaeales archaeon]|nr:DUF169 domain-containing protein [Candidatus Hodarchaeales archaeon]